MLANSSTLVSKEKKKKFLETGYVTFENIIPPESLEMIRSECDRLVGEIDAELERDGIETRGLTQRNHNYFFPAYQRSVKLRSFIFSDLTEELCQALLGDTAFLFYETFIVKYPRRGLPFSWHQDSGYINRKHKPFITLWCTLDDVSDANGSLRVLPYKTAGTKERQPHILLDASSPEKVGYFGDEPGEPIEMPAGSIAVLSSTTFHRSGPNVSDRLRRAYLIDYSVEPILSDDDDKKLRAMAEVFLKDGNRVA
jgi:ectoine hydroxylase-related dioxygenase (phytanoyl-CoA dioxygenase family)